MNLTLSVDKGMVQRARTVARSMDKSLNQLIREYLENLAGLDQPEAEMEELRRLSLESGGRSRGWTYDREEIHDRS